jgi:hypothetical protein
MNLKGSGGTAVDAENTAVNEKPDPEKLSDTEILSISLGTLGGAGIAAGAAAYASGSDADEKVPEKVRIRRMRASERERAKVEAAAAALVNTKRRENAGIPEVGCPGVAGYPAAGAEVKAGLLPGGDSPLLYGEWHDHHPHGVGR